MYQLSDAHRSPFVSDLAATHALMNCLVKEFALPLSLLRYEWPKNVKGLPIRTLFDGKHAKGIPLHIVFPNQQEFFVLVDRKDNLGSYYYLSDVFMKFHNTVWNFLKFDHFAKNLIFGCSEITKHLNEDLFSQVLASRNLIEDIHQYAMTLTNLKLNDYRYSEQALWFGHPSHPAPKAREWSESGDRYRFSPEFGVSSALHNFEVKRDGLWIKSNGMNDDDVLANIADQSLATADSVIISLHPVQAQLFMQDSRVQECIKQGIIKDLGCQGKAFYPTASIRTWFNEDHDYFLKVSLHVRITNCVRKNAWYELESTILIDRLLNTLYETQGDTLGGFEPVSEPAVLCWAPLDVSNEDKNWFKEQTGVILRRNFCRTEGSSNCVLAGAMFGRSLELRPQILDFMADLYGHRLNDDDLLAWFESYQSLLLHPILSLFYHHGIVMEPHLQNTVIIHNDGQPTKVLLRDFEGVKLTKDLGMLRIEAKELHPRVSQSLMYSREKGWQRISYCLFVNNLSEAILALTWQRPELASQMWQIVYKQLQIISNQLSVATPELDQLLAGGKIPCKANFKVRLAAKADREAGYVELNSPWSNAYV